LKNSFAQFCFNFVDEFKSYSNSDKLARSIWLLGPFLLLIERSPADIWLTSLAAMYCYKTIKTRNTDFTKASWFVPFLLLAITLTISAILSERPTSSILEVVSWFRFPCFLMASVYWLGNTRLMFKAMILSVGIATTIQCLAICFLFLTQGQIDGRIAGLYGYGDWMAGSYVAKVSLPLVILLCSIGVTAQENLKRALSISLFIFFVISVHLTGERINFLIITCSGLLACVAWNRNPLMLLTIVALIALSIFVLMIFDPASIDRWTNDATAQIGGFFDSGYYRAMLPGLLAFENSPFLGIGPGNLRELCPHLLPSQTVAECHPHPHNFYIQLLGEVGVIGFVSGVLFIGSLILDGLKIAKEHPNIAPLFLMAIPPLALFWPIASNPDLFGQWHNLFLWTGLAVSFSAQKGYRTS